MSLGWVIAGSIVQLHLGCLLFMLVAFSASGIGGREGPGRAHAALLNLCMIALPASALIGAGMVVYEYVRHAGSEAYWWYALPVAVTGCYLGYAITLGRRERCRLAVR